jgi:hypothetical protein
LQIELEALLLRHGVDLVLSGHVHAYERTHPVRDPFRSEKKMQKEMAAS